MAGQREVVPTLRGGADPAAGQRQLSRCAGFLEDVQPPLRGRNALERGIHVSVGAGAVHQVRRVRGLRAGAHRPVRGQQGRHAVRQAQHGGEG